MFEGRPSSHVILLTHSPAYERVTVFSMQDINHISSAVDAIVEAVSILSSPEAS